MGYQLGIILVLIVVAILVSKKFTKSEDELNDIDKELD